MVDRPNKFQAALLAGIIAGVVSSIPFVNFVNICCCLWLVIGGAFAARTLIVRSTVFPVTSGDGAIVGALAGVISSIVYLVIGIPIALFSNKSFVSLLEYISTQTQDANVRAQIQKAIDDMQRQGVAEQIPGALLTWIIFAALGIGFATLGGVIGVAMFEKRKGQLAPPPPPPPGGYPGY